jgi:hypothetical protein
VGDEDLNQTSRAQRSEHVSTRFSTNPESLVLRTRSDKPTAVPPERAGVNGMTDLFRNDN